MTSTQAHRFRRIVDLSHPLKPGMPGWPTQPTLSYEHIKAAAVDGYTLTLIRRMVTHTGTHIDAPAHFLPEGRTVDQVSFDSFYGEGIVVDMTKKRPGEEISTEDLSPYDREISEGIVVMMRTGWDHKLAWTNEYLFKWPHLGVESSEYLVKKGVKAVGVDGLSVGGWSESVPAQGPLAESAPSEVHRILLSNGILIIEMLANLDGVLAGQKLARGFFIFAPLNLVNAEGSPCRAIALLD